MQNAYHTTATVLPGNRIEVATPELREGDKVRVVVIPDPNTRSETRSGLEIIEAYNGLPLYGSIEAVENYLNEERDSWDR